MSASIMQFDNGFGEVKNYKTFSARLPEFHEKYPLEKGFRVVIEVRSALDLHSELRELHRLAIKKGHNPLDIGLPALPPTNEYVFYATLLDPHEGVISSASSYRQVLYLKDWEKGETAARQRLIASVGFSGDVYDDDEREDAAQFNGSNKPSYSPQAMANIPQVAKPADIVSKPAKKQAEEKPAMKSEPSDSSQDDGFTLDSPNAPVQTEATDPAQGHDGVEASAQVADSVASTEAAPEPELDSPSQAESDPQEPAPAPQGDSSQSDDEDEQVPQRILNQIRHHCALRGIEVPTVTSVKEAKKKLKELMSPSV